jgi:hypothetical protein
MCEGIYQTRKEELDNIRESLRISYDRSNQLVALNNQTIGLVVAILIGLITFLGSAYFTSKDPNRYLTIIISIQISVITLLFWRYYAHILDNNIVESYSKIIFAENALNIPLELTLLSSLEKSLSLLKNDSYKKFTCGKRLIVIQELININRIGYRYHDILDFVAGGITLVLLMIQYGFVMTPQPIPFNFYFGFLVWLPLSYIILLCGLAKDLKLGIKIQRDPSEAEKNEIIRKIVDSN